MPRNPATRPRSHAPMPVRYMDFSKATPESVQDALGALGTYLSLAEADEWLQARRRRMNG